jgi:hypothetical protein
MTQHDRFIDRLTSDPVERSALMAVASTLDGNPFMAAGRAEAILQELARPAVKPDGTPFSGEESLAYMTDFAGAIGVPADVISPALRSIGDVDTDAIPTETIEDSAVIAHLEQAMRDDPDGWRKNEHAQQEYRAALERLNTPAVPDGTMTYSSNDAGRRAEIEQAMRTDGGRAYWNNPGMQREYGEILQRQTAPLVPPEPALG